MMILSTVEDTVGNEEHKAKGGRLKIGVSTKVEQAWYVDPELMAGRGDEQAKVVIDADQPPSPDATMTLGESDIQTSDVELPDDDEDARHYKNVSLRGALLAPKDAVADEDEGDDASRTKKPSTPPPPPVAKPAYTPSSAPDRVSSKPSPTMLGGLDLSKIPPIWLAAAAFALGVITTLIGVFIAL